MTREEATTSLRNLRTFHNGSYAEAIDMAIKALGSWEKYSDELWKKAYKRGYDDGVDAYAKHIGLCREEAEEIPEEDCYVCDCGYGWNKKKVIRHHYCPNCGKAVNGKGRWIPCSERLPDTEEDVLATDGVDIFVAYYYIDKWGSFDRSYDEYNNPVTAWQPLPQPYKEEERGEDE